MASNTLVQQLLNKLQKASNTMPKTISNSSMIQNLSKLNNLKTQMQRLSNKQGNMTPEDYVRLGELTHEYALLQHSFKKYQGPSKPTSNLMGVRGYGSTRRNRRKNRKSRRNNRRN